ncbi:MAG: MFS transporter [Bryobacteraceae bacterium]
MFTSIRFRLSVMMFLEYMVWGAWYPDFSAYLGKVLQFSDGQIGAIYSLLAIGCMIAPFFAGQLADRFMPTDRLLAILHLAGAVPLYIMASATNYDGVWTWMLLWAVLFGPTLALTNSICFHHMPAAEGEFGLVRVWGTIGWIAVGLLLGVALREWLPGLFGTMGGFDGMWLAAILSLLLGLYCLTLPHTPPARKNDSPLAFLGALKLLKDREFAIFLALAFIVATELMFYFILTGPFLYSIGLPAGQAPAWMAIAQAAEIITMIFLPKMLKKWGTRGTMALGILAWPVRYGIFALGGPLWLVLASLTLHGICYVCFFTASYIYVDQVAGPEIRASAQGLIAFVLLGVGLVVGSWFAGYIAGMFKNDYTKIFLVPLVLTVLCAIVFMALFRPKAQAA